MRVRLAVAESDCAHAELLTTMQTDEDHGVARTARKRAKKAPPRFENLDDRGACSGSGFKLSLLVANQSACRVTVGAVDLGVAPLFK